MLFRFLKQLHPKNWVISGLYLLNIFSKIFEKILKDKTLNFINKNNLLASEQFGFTTNSSTKQAITTIYDKFRDNLDNTQYTYAIFLDIEKAFDTIDQGSQTRGPRQILGSQSNFFYFDVSKENLGTTPWRVRGKALLSPAKLLRGLA